VYKKRAEQTTEHGTARKEGAVPHGDRRGGVVGATERGGAGAKGTGPTHVIWVKDRDLDEGGGVGARSQGRAGGGARGARHNHRTELLQRRDPYHGGIKREAN